MRLLALIFSVTLASPAFAGGIFDSSTATPAYAGTSLTTLWSKNLLGGAVDSGDALRIRVDAATVGYGAEGGAISVKLNGQELTAADFVGAGEAAIFDFEVWRTGTTTGTVIGGVVFNGAWCPLPALDVTGLAWTSGQVLAVTGIADVTNGLALLRAGEQH